MSNDKLQVIVRESGLEPTKAQAILNVFQDTFRLAADWERKAKEIVVTDGSQVAAIALAREGRLLLREKRIGVENTRKELKEQSLREGKLIDGIANALKGVIVPVEEYLKRQENFVALKEEAERDERERVFQESEKKRLAKEAEDKRLEDERIREENEELKRVADEREAKLHARERERMVENRKQNVEKERIRKEGKNAVAAEKAKAEAAKKVDDEKRELERKAEAETREKAEAERIRLEEKLASERLEARSKQAKLELEKKKLKREKLEREEAERERLAAQVECPECGHKFTPEGRAE